MWIPPAYDPQDRLDGICRALAADVDRIVEDLEFRREFLREIWSVSRDRGGFLDTITTRWRDLGMDDLVELETDDVVAIDGFYRALDDFQLYLRFTEDMPATLLDRYDRTLETLKELGEDVIERLGGAPDRGEVDDPTVHQHVLSFFRPPRRDPEAERHAKEAEEAGLEWTRDTQAELESLYVTEGEPVLNPDDDEG